MDVYTNKRLSDLEERVGRLEQAPAVPTQASLLTLAELHVLLQATVGSTRIVDRFGYFGYDDATRLEVYNAIVERMGSVPIGVLQAKENTDEPHG